MRVPLVLLGGIVVLSVAVARALSCVCSPLECDSLTDDDCPGGLTWDPCKCCKVCARVEGEPCGGLFGFSGRCAVGLQCLIKNLVPHPRDSAVDEGICTKIPGRTRRQCPNGPKLSEPGCNLVGEGSSTAEAESGQDVGKCVCGRPVLWCPEEPEPYMYKTRHECELNLAAKIAYDGLYETAETPTDNGEVIDCIVEELNNYNYAVPNIQEIVSNQQSHTSSIDTTTASNIECSLSNVKEVTLCQQSYTDCGDCPSAKVNNNNGKIFEDITDKNKKIKQID